MRLAERKEMLKSLCEAEAVCGYDDALTDIRSDIGKAADYLVLLVAGERKCKSFEIDGLEDSHASMPLKKRLELVEGLVRGVYGKFEDALAADYDGGLTYGERMVLGVVDDVVFGIAGLRDDIRAEEGKETEHDKKTA